MDTTIQMVQLNAAVPVELHTRLRLLSVAKRIPANRLLILILSKMLPILEDSEQASQEDSHE